MLSDGHIKALRIRRAAIADLPGIWDTLYTIEYGTTGGPSRESIPPYLGHEMVTGEMWVAEMEGRIVGYSALIKRRNIGFIAELFVRPEHQSGDIGAALFHQLLEEDLPVLCTMSSSDPRALSLYIRAGLRPQWPHFHLAGRETRLPDSMANVDIEPAESAETRIIAWDAEICGRLRPEEHAYWQSTHATPVWCRRDGEIVGYGYVHDVRASGTNPASVILGPIGARSPGDADACVRALLRWACGRGDVFHIGVPGQHPSLPALLRSGFRIESVETFCCSCATAFFDPRLYIPSLTLEGTALL